MRLFGRRRVVIEEEALPPPREEIERRLAEARSRRELLANGLVGLIQCVKALALDFNEIGAQEVKAGLDDLTRLVRADERTVPLDGEIARRQGEVLGYADRLKDYLDEREAELKRIVTLLTSGLSSIGNDNAAYHARIYQGTVTLEQLSQLDDIKRVRRELTGEVGRLREVVQTKQREDKKRIDELQHEVHTLRSDVERAKNDALLDGLTGAANRLAFDQQMQLLVDRNQIAEAPFSLLMIDVDHFKRINDRFGHPVGDRVLMALVLACRERVRRNDLLARYGGEEFAIILPGASARIALKKAKELCENQASRQYSVGDSDFVSFTISVGVTAFRNGDTMASVIERADRALYDAKDGGRNRAALLK